VKRTLCGLILLMAIGCSNSSPTAPTPTQTQPPTTAPGPTVIQLQWVAASGCGPVTMPPTQPAFSDATITQQGDGSIIASWPYTANGRNARLYARFVSENNAYALCSWDIADV